MLAGPEIWDCDRCQALVMSKFKGQFVALHRVGDGVPGPPFVNVIPFRSAAAFIEATSNAGPGEGGGEPS
jgi:hypothetical protein